MYRKNKETGLIEKIGKTRSIRKADSKDLTQGFYIDLEDGKRLVADSNDISYDEKESITANELHTKALKQEVKKCLKQ